MYKELLAFMKKIFWEEAEVRLTEFLDKLEIPTVENSTKIQRKFLAEEIRKNFPQYSAGRRNILYAELLTILRLDIFDLGKEKLKLFSDTKYYDEEGNLVSGSEILLNRENKYFSTKEEFVEYKMEKQRKVVNKFWRNVDKSLTKFEVVFNLFWMHAGEAEIRGMKHEDVMRITNKALVGIKNDLEKAFGDVRKEFGISDLIVRKARFNFHGSSLEIKEKNNIPYKGEEKIVKSIESFWNKVNERYSQFKNILVVSLNVEIELKNKNMKDTELMEKTETQLREIWNDINSSYKMLQQNLRKIQENSLES